MTQTPELRTLNTKIGARIRYRRWELGMTQSQLADGCGVKFQQIQKYENGMNRVSAAMLCLIAKRLGRPVSYFYDDLDGEPTAADPRPEMVSRQAAVAAGELDRLDKVRPEIGRAVRDLVRACTEARI